jgi:hypothetical protein
VTTPAYLYLTETGILPAPDAERLERAIDEAVRALTPRRVRVKVVDFTLRPEPKISLSVVEDPE